MRMLPAQEMGRPEFRRSLDRLEGLPLRPSTARLVLSASEDADDSDSLVSGEVGRVPTPAELDPGWVLARPARAGDRPTFLETVATHPWWQAGVAGGPVGSALDRLWKYSVAVAFAARRAAREAEDPDPDAVGRAGLLHRLGLWAVAAIQPDRLVAWMGAEDAERRRALESRWLGTSLTGEARRLAARWGLEPLMIEVAWLHGEGDEDLLPGTDDPARLGFVRRGIALAERTPWALDFGTPKSGGPVEPRVRILMAEVQSRCPGSFVEADATPREERLTRDNARLRVAVGRLDAEKASLGRFARAVAESSPHESPEAWADRAALAWCGEPGILAARVVWADRDGGSAPPIEDEARPASRIIHLGDPARPAARVHLWEPPEGGVSAAVPPATRAAWDAWAILVEDRMQDRLRLDEAVGAHRLRVSREESSRRRAILEGLAEFAAGAGHELNNPLAVIVGRAQLLLAGHDQVDPGRSLRAIIAQAQRAHRILRDLMYVARPPELRPRPCQPDEIIKACFRDLQPEAEARGIRLVAESRDPGLRVYVDPDPLRQVADVLVRNALEATPSGGLVEFHTSGDPRKLRWTVHDNGRGIGPGEGAHLFDPFYCGRQAGRGLGLGLPRASRILAQIGGELRWQSSPGIGTTFQATIPVAPIPAASEEAVGVEAQVERAGASR